MNFLKNKKIEIAVILIIIIVSASLFFLINFLLQKRSDALFNNEILEIRCNAIKSGETSKTILEKELSEIKSENERLSVLLPKDLKIQEAQAKLVEIVKNNKMLNIEKCTVTELELDENIPYKQIRVIVKDFYGTYEQVKAFLDYITNCKNKTVIEKIEFQSDENTNNIKGQTLVFSFYSAK